MIRGLWFVVGALILSAGGCGVAELGEPCDEPGSTEVCVEGAVCSSEPEPRCRTICDFGVNCLRGEACEAIAGCELRACIPVR